MFWLLMLIIGATLLVTLVLCLQIVIAKMAGRKHSKR